ncbi:helix-turn-helix domain-containing protein (plasmid) [Nocardia sp. CA-084685]|uniref:MmyB family transcriptional regulator n=1 Tax=Nocardia sp. CA-084685 TaxID=3239970 RepID=UPI003D97ADCB
MVYAGDTLLSRYMKDRREKAGLTIPQLAAVMETMTEGVSQSSIEKYENGSRKPTDKALAAWFDGVGVNYWYRDKIRELLSPELFQHEYGEIPEQPIPEDIEVLNSLGIPAAFLSDPMWGLLAANDQFLTMFPGLEPGMNVALWMLTSPVARLQIVNWDLRTHMLIAGIKGIAPGIVPDAEIEDFCAQGSKMREFQTFWDEDPTTEQLLNSDVILRDQPHARGGRYISRTGRWFHPRRRNLLYTLSYTETPSPFPA